jgi:hypothetical protein
MATPSFYPRVQLISDGADISPGTSQTAQVQVVPTTAGAAYAAGAVVGGLLTFTGASRAAAGSGLVQAVTVTFASGVTPTMDMILLNATPSGGTITNNVALALFSGDLAKVVGVVRIADAALLGVASPSIVQGQAQGLPFRLPAGTALYGILVLRTAATLVGTTDATVTLSVLQD